MKKVLTLLVCLTSFCQIFGYDFRVDGIYYKITSLKDLTVGVTFSTSNYNSYSGTVSIPESVIYSGNTYRVTSIEEYAFCDCSELTNISIPNSVTFIGNYAFSGCSSLPVIDNLRYADTYLVAAVDKNKTQYSLKEGIRFIGSEAFRSCYNMTSITIPNSVIGIGNQVFYDCLNLSIIMVESGNSKYDSRNDCNAIVETSSNKIVSGCKNSIIPNDVVSIGDNAFCACPGLTSIILPNSVTSIGNLAFGFCSSLTSITIPNSVTNIDSYAFYYCSNLTSVTISNSLTNISESIFSGCKSLTSITIPNSVTNIGDYAFRYCTSLSSVFLPNSITSIGTQAFSYCSSLADFYVEWNDPLYISSNLFQKSSYSSATLHVPAGSKEKYEDAMVWKNFRSIVEFDLSTLYSIERNLNIYNPTFDLQGRRVLTPIKGQLIINSGKKGVTIK